MKKIIPVMMNHRAMMCVWAFTIALSVFDVVGWRVMLKEINQHKNEVAFAVREATLLAHPAVHYKVAAISVPGNGLHSECFFIKLKGPGPYDGYVCSFMLRVDENSPNATKWAGVQEGTEIGLQYSSQVKPGQDHISFSYLVPRRLLASR